MATTGSPVASGIQLKTDPKQITFQVSKALVPIWRRIFLLRYFIQLGEHDCVEVKWVDYDSRNKKLDLDDEKLPYKSTLPSSLYKSVTQLFLDSRKLITITFYYTTQKCLVQGNVTQDWVESEFKMLHDKVNEISKSKPTNPDDIIKSIPLDIPLQSKQDESTENIDTLSDHLDKQENETCQEKTGKDIDNNDKFNTNKDRSIKDVDIIQSIQTLENDHITSTSELRSDIQTFKVEILDAIQNLSNRVQALEKKCETPHLSSFERKLEIIHEDVTYIKESKTEQSKPQQSNTDKQNTGELDQDVPQTMKCNNDHFVETLIELTSQISKMECCLENITKSRETTSIKADTTEKDESVKESKKDTNVTEKTDINVDTHNRFEILESLSEENLPKKCDTEVQRPIDETNIEPKADLWIIGSSVTREINPRLVYRRKFVRVTTLKEKTINGAQSFIRKGIVKSKVVLLQIGSNDLNRKHPDDVLKEYKNLLDVCKEHIPNAQIVISEVLPRFQRDLNWRDIYENKRKNFNREIEKLAAERKCSFSKSPYIQEYDVIDGIHPSVESGIPKLVAAYKRVTNPLLGIQTTDKYQTSASQSFDNYRGSWNNDTNFRYEHNRQSREPYQNFANRPFNKREKFNGYTDFRDNRNNQYMDPDESSDYYKDYYDNRNMSKYKQSDPFDTGSQAKLKWFLKSFIEELG